jgi:hypothetical protein
MVEMWWFAGSGVLSFRASWSMVVGGRVECEWKEQMK